MKVYFLPHRLSVIQNVACIDHYWRCKLFSYMASSCSHTSASQNRGVGLGIVNRILASSDPYTLYITSRSGNDLPKAKDPHTFHPVKLDISDPSSVKAFAAQVEKEQGKGGVDALINNAGVNVDQSKGYNKEAVRETMKTNFYGTRAVSPAVCSLQDNV